MSKKKKVTAEDVIRWIEDATPYQRQQVRAFTSALIDAHRAGECMLDTEDEPF